MSWRQRQLRREANRTPIRNWRSNFCRTRDTVQKSREIRRAPPVAATHFRATVTSQGRSLLLNGEGPGDLSLSHSRGDRQYRAGLVNVGWGFESSAGKLFEGRTRPVMGPVRPYLAAPRELKRSPAPSGCS